MTPYILEKDLSKFKRFHIIIFVLLFTKPVIALSQQRATWQDRFIALPDRNIRLDSLSRWIARESGFVFSFNVGEISPSQKIIFSNTKMKLGTLLLYLHEHHQLTHKIIGNHIILYNDSLPKKKIQVTSNSHKNDSPQKMMDAESKRESAGIPFMGATKPPGITTLSYIGARTSFKMTSPALPRTAGEHLSKQSFIPPIKPLEYTPHPVRNSIGFPGKQHNTEKQPAPGRQFSKEGSNFYISASFTASEVLYVNPQLSAGLPWLFVLAAWGTNFKAAGIFYGLGTSINLNEDWALQLSASSGTLSKDLKWEPQAPDSVIRIKTRLTRINLLGEKQIGKRWRVQFGPVFNFMRSTYALHNRATASSSPISGANFSKNYYILHPPYTLRKNNNSETDVDKKLWIGLQIGFSYRLR